MNELPRVNRKYKDSLFRKLFSEPEDLLSLYNAVNGTRYEDASEGHVSFDSSEIALSEVCGILQRYYRDARSLDASSK